MLICTRNRSPGIPCLLQCWVPPPSMWSPSIHATPMTPAQQKHTRNLSWRPSGTSLGPAMALCPQGSSTSTSLPFPMRLPASTQPVMPKPQAAISGQPPTLFQSTGTEMFETDANLGNCDLSFSFFLPRFLLSHPEPVASNTPAQIRAITMITLATIIATVITTPI